MGHAAILHSAIWIGFLSANNWWKLMYPYFIGAWRQSNVLLAVKRRFPEVKSLIIGVKNNISKDVTVKLFKILKENYLLPQFQTNFPLPHYPALTFPGNCSQNFIPSPGQKKNPACDLYCSCSAVYMCGR